MSFRRTAKHKWWQRDVVVLATALLTGSATCNALQYLENFDQPGKPSAPGGLQWDYRDELGTVETWNEIVPGDGYAYLTARRDFLKRGRGPWRFWPFQTLSFGPIGGGTRISMRAKNTAIPGLAAMIFTYREQDTIDEIDLEITANDTECRDPRHKTGPDGGWTDLRMATWIEAAKSKPEPASLTKQPAQDARGEPRSLQDGEFHIYTIEWDRTVVRFFIDEITQHTIFDAVPDRPTTVIFGLRQMPWAGRAGWREPQTMTIDWISAETLDKK